MPELPEVETVRCGIASNVIGQKVQKILIRQTQLRWLVPENLPAILQDQSINKVWRRGKYLLLDFATGTLIIHLGMSGSLQLLSKTIPYKKHDHVDFILNNNMSLRFNDPRRFGCILWTEADPLKHKLLKNLGPEPLSGEFNGEYLFKKSRNSSRAIKLFIMDSHIVVGVGNIYANESLFLSGVNPLTKAKDIALETYNELSKQIKAVLKKAMAESH